MPPDPENFIPDLDAGFIPWEDGLSNLNELCGMDKAGAINYLMAFGWTAMPQSTDMELWMRHRRGMRVSFRIGYSISDLRPKILYRKTILF